MSHRNAQLAEAEYRVACEESIDKLLSISGRIPGGQLQHKVFAQVLQQDQQIPQVMSGSMWNKIRESDLSLSFNKAPSVRQPLCSQSSDAKSNPVGIGCEKLSSFF